MDLVFCLLENPQLKMKRENEEELDQENGDSNSGDQQGQSKKRREESKLRLLISSNVAGAIIGEK